jgi:hypothetical protein
VSWCGYTEAMRPGVAMQKVNSRGEKNPGPVSSWQHSDDTQGLHGEHEQDYSWQPLGSLPHPHQWHWGLGRKLRRLQVTW